MRWFSAVLLLILTACGPKCLKGHYEPRWRAPYNSMEHIQIGDIPIFYTKHHEGYWYQEWVCDLYEVEKEIEQ